MYKLLSIVVHALLIYIGFRVWEIEVQFFGPVGFDFWQWPLTLDHAGALSLGVGMVYGVAICSLKVERWINAAPTTAKQA